jgi:hypothetical protein
LLLQQGEAVAKQTAADIAALLKPKADEKIYSYRLANGETVTRKTPMSGVATGRFVTNSYGRMVYQESTENVVCYTATPVVR